MTPAGRLRNLGTPPRNWDREDCLQKTAPAGRGAPGRLGFPPAAPDPGAPGGGRGAQRREPPLPSPRPGPGPFSPRTFPGFSLINARREPVLGVPPPPPVQRPLLQPGNGSTGGRGPDRPAAPGFQSDLGAGGGGPSEAPEGKRVTRTKRKRRRRAEAGRREAERRGGPGWATGSQAHPRLPAPKVSPRVTLETTKVTRSG